MVNYTKGGKNMKKTQSISDFKNQILTSEHYISDGKIIVIYNNTERIVHQHIDFFELVYQGSDLYLNFSTTGTGPNFDQRINLSTVHNINGVIINPAT